MLLLLRVLGCFECVVAFARGTGAAVNVAHTNGKYRNKNRALSPKNAVCVIFDSTCDERGIPPRALFQAAFRMAFAREVREYFTVYACACT